MIRAANFAPNLQNTPSFFVCSAHPCRRCPPYSLRFFRQLRQSVPWRRRSAIFSVLRLLDRPHRIRYNDEILCTALHPPIGVRDLQYKLSRRCPLRAWAGPPWRQQMIVLASVGQLYVPQVPFSILLGPWNLPFSMRCTQEHHTAGAVPRSQQEVFLYGYPIPDCAPR